MHATHFRSHHHRLALRKYWLIWYLFRVSWPCYHVINNWLIALHNMNICSALTCDIGVIWWPLRFHSFDSLIHIWPSCDTKWTDIRLKALGGKVIGTSVELFHNFIDFKKAFDRVSHDRLWRVLKQCNIDSQLIEVIISLYDEATSAVLLNGSVGDSFRTTVGVRQGCTLSPALFNILCNLQFAYNISLLGGSEEELQLTERLRKVLLVTVWRSATT